MIIVYKGASVVYLSRSQRAAFGATTGLTEGPEKIASLQPLALLALTAVGDQDLSRLQVYCSQEG